MIRLRRFVLIFCVISFLGSQAFATSYYIASSGSDSNSGTTTSAPWAHAPGMPACSSTCASITPNPGDRFIFRGGDTWHFGNSSASPYTGGTWTWAWRGTSSQEIYIGVDQTWYSGSSWARPILTGDNHTSTSAVASCTYQSGTNNVMLTFNDMQYYQFDNFELLGLCEASSSQSNVYIVDGNVGPSTYSNLYIHGWTHLTYSCGSYCFNMTGIDGGSGGQDVIENTVIDGSDSDPAGIAAIFNALYDVHESVIRYTANVLGGNCHTFHDNLVQYSYEPGDNVAHGNIYECNGEANVSTPNTFYNNVIGPTGDAVGVGIWPEPATSQTDYYFNNVMYGTTCGGGNCVNIGQNGSSQGKLIFFNNTFQNPSNTAILQDNGTNAYAHPLITANNHWITNASGGVSAIGSTSTTDIAMPQSTATVDGYTSSQNYVFSPTSGSSPTVGKGTNETSYCSSLSGDSTAYAACQSDTSYSCVYETTNHTVSCPARSSVQRSSSGNWSVGAYIYGTSPQAATGLVGTLVQQ